MKGEKNLLTLFLLEKNQNFSFSRKSMEQMFRNKETTTTKKKNLTQSGVSLPLQVGLVWNQSNQIRVFTAEVGRLRNVLLWLWIKYCQNNQINQHTNKQTREGERRPCGTNTLPNPFKFVGVAKRSEEAANGQQGSQFVFPFWFPRRGGVKKRAIPRVRLLSFASALK